MVQLVVRLRFADLCVWVVYGCGAMVNSVGIMMLFIVALC